MPDLFLIRRLCFNIVEMLIVNPAISIPEEELEFSYVRAAGPGGQNVNKVSTAVELRFDAGRSSSLTEAVRRRLKKMAGRRMTADGVLILLARRFRTQEQNRAEARERLRAMVEKVAQPPKRRRKTKPTVASRERRLQTKKQQSNKKQKREKGAVWLD
jgi:ribosome-associated protein